MLDRRGYFFRVIIVVLCLLLVSNVAYARSNIYLGLSKWDIVRISAKAYAAEKGIKLLSRYSDFWKFAQYSIVLTIIYEGVKYFINWGMSQGERLSGWTYAFSKEINQSTGQVRYRNTSIGLHDTSYEGIVRQLINYGKEYDYQAMAWKYPVYEFSEDNAYLSSGWLVTPYYYKRVGWTYEFGEAVSKSMLGFVPGGDQYSYAVTDEDIANALMHYRDALVNSGLRREDIDRLIEVLKNPVKIEGGNEASIEVDRTVDIPRVIERIGSDSIVDNVVEGIKALFVPNPAKVQEKIENLKDVFSRDVDIPIGKSLWKDYSLSLAGVEVNLPIRSMFENTQFLAFVRAALNGTLAIMILVNIYLSIRRIGGG